jgi:hypothetical protein
MWFTLRDARISWMSNAAFHPELALDESLSLSAT